MNIRVKKSVAAALSAFVSFSAVSNNAFGMKMFESKSKLEGETEGFGDLPHEDDTKLRKKLKKFLKEHWVAHLLYSIGMTVVGVTAAGMLIYKSRSGKIGVVDSEKFVKEVDMLAKSSPEIASMRASEEADGKVGKKGEKLSESVKKKKGGKHKKSKGVKKVNKGEKVGKNDVALRK